MGKGKKWHRPITERLLELREVDLITGCWNYIGSIRKDGYANFKIGRVNQLAHRVAYVAFRGSIPEGLCIDHLCRNNRCINPDHLEAVTFRTNVLRGESIYAKNARKKFCINGHEFDKVGVYLIRDRWRRCLECKRLDAIKYCHKPGVKQRRTELQRIYRKRRKSQ